MNYVLSIYENPASKVHFMWMLYGKLFTFTKNLYAMDDVEVVVRPMPHHFSPLHTHTHTHMLFLETESVQRTWATCQRILPHNKLATQI
jgi:hypothetical protein